MIWSKELEKAFKSCLIDKEKNKKSIALLRKTTASFCEISKLFVGNNAPVPLTEAFKKEILNSKIIYLSISYWKSVCSEISPNKFATKERTFVYKKMPIIADIISKLNNNKLTKKMSISFLEKVIIDLKGTVGKRINHSKIMSFSKALLKYLKNTKATSKSLMYSYLSFLLEEIKGKGKRNKEKSNALTIKSSLNSFFDNLNSLIKSFNLRKSQNTYDLKKEIKNFEMFLIQVQTETNISLVYIDIQEYFEKWIKSFKGKRPRSLKLLSVAGVDSFMKEAFKSENITLNKNIKNKDKKILLVELMNQLKKLGIVYSPDLFIFCLFLISICFIRGFLFVGKK